MSWLDHKAELDRMYANAAYVRQFGGNALSTQVGGSHYKDQAIQPVEYIHANGIGYFEGNVIKYVTRWKKKNGLADLEKAKHYIELLIELEAKRASSQGEETPRPESA